VGTLCVVDPGPSELKPPEQLEALRALSRQVWRNLAPTNLKSGWKQISKHA